MNFVILKKSSGMKNELHTKFRDENNNLTKNIYAFSLLIMCSKVLLLVDGIHCLIDKLMEIFCQDQLSHSEGGKLLWCVWMERGGGWG